MTMLLAIALTAMVVGVCVAALVRHSVKASIVEAISGRHGADPVVEHHRLLDIERARVAAAEERADLMGLALDAMASGVIITARGGGELVRNGFARTVSARSHEQTLVDAAAAELLEAALQGEPSERQVEIFGPPARMLFIHAVPIASGDEVIGALAVVDDVTDLHRIDKTRRDFIANLSHELRTPVGAVSLLAEMLEDETDESTRRNLSQRITLEAQRMSSTIDDLLELSRIESDTENYDEVIVLGAVADEAAARCRVAAEVSGVQIGVTVPANPITLLGNRDQLVSALSNLIDNAVKYSDDGDTISVRVRADGDAASVTVQDTGRGIPARDLDRIFERFYRVDRSRDSTTGGTGIGLSIVRHVALNHGGRVSVKSVEGEGSTFEMVLPMTPSLEVPLDEAVR